MEGFRFLILTFVTVTIYFFLQQLWMIWSDWPRIAEFVQRAASNEYVFDSKYEPLDTNVFDPNDQVMGSKEKWRCVQIGNFNWYQLNQYGGLVNSVGDFMVFSDESSCTRNLYLHQVGTRIYKDPCPRYTSLCDAIIAIKSS